MFLFFWPPPLVTMFLIWQTKIYFWILTERSPVSTFAMSLRQEQRLFGSSPLPKQPVNAEQKNNWILKTWRLSWEAKYFLLGQEPPHLLRKQSWRITEKKPNIAFVIKTVTHFNSLFIINLILHLISWRLPILQYHRNYQPRSSHCHWKNHSTSMQLCAFD